MTEINSKFSIIKESKIGKNSKIYDLVNLFGCKIGENTKIDSYVYIEESVEIGNYCKIRPFCFIPTGVKIGNNVFIGPNVTFTNDKFPRVDGEWEIMETIVGNDVSIGAGTTILPGLILGDGCMIGAGSVVTKNIPKNAVVYGNPATITKILE